MRKATISCIIPGLVFTVLFSFLSSCQDKGLPVLDMEHLLKNELIEIDNGFNNYTEAFCNFLKESSSLNPQNIRNIHCDGNDLYLLFPDVLLHYDLATGNLLSSIKSEGLTNYTDFAFNRSAQKFYILDNKGSQVIEMSISGQIEKTIKLDTTHTYVLIKHLKDRRFLVPIQTASSPSAVLVDIEQGKVEEYKFLDNKKIKDMPRNSDSIWSKYPLYVADETTEGVRVKYLFDDRIYLCTNDNVTTDYFIKMGNQKVKHKYPWSVTNLKANDRFRVIKFWHTGEKTYVLSQKIIKNIFGTYDYKILSQFADSKNVNSFMGIIASNMLASLNPGKEEIFMDDQGKRFLSIRKLNIQEKQAKGKWPRHMMESGNAEDLVVSIFTMK